MNTRVSKTDNAKQKRHVTCWWLALGMIGLALAFVSATPAVAQQAPIQTITCVSTDLPGCVLMVTNGQNTASKPILVQGENLVDFVCQDTYPPTKDVGVKIPVAPGRKVIAFSCPADAGTMIMRCEVSPCTIAFIP